MRRDDAQGRNFEAFGALFLVLLYTAECLGHPALPGNDTRCPLGWWVWFDQSKFLQSTQALARFDFPPAHHWYPLGYALLGAPFARMMPQHPFFFVDLAALLITHAAFNRFALHCDASLRRSVILSSEIQDEVWLRPRCSALHRTRFD